MIDRLLFLPMGAWDDNLGFQLSTTQSVPSRPITELMVDLLDLRPDDEVLEIGTGSGYQAACIAEHCKHLTTLEVDPIPGVDKKIPENVTMVTGNFLQMDTDEKYDAIVVTCGIREWQVNKFLPMSKIGTRIVAPVGEPSAQELRKYLVTWDVIGNQMKLDDRGPFGYVKFTWIVGE